MSRREDLQNLLEDCLESRRVHFQPPESMRLEYPCIIYERSRIGIRHADNVPYSHNYEYTITLIYQDPDSVIPKRLAQISGCAFVRHFKTHKLNHDVFRLNH